MKKMLLISILAGLLFACSQSQPGADIPLEDQREYANALYNRQLYYQALNEYGKLLDYYKMDNKTKANICYTIANLYFEEIRDYSNALAYYMKIKHVYKTSSLLEETNKRIVACLERLGKSNAAASLLKETASIKGSETPIESLPGDTVAVVGEQVITTGDLDRFFAYYRQTLSPEEQQKEATLNEKLAFLRDYVKREVLYNSAKLQNLDQDPQVLEISFIRKKELMIRKLLENEIQSKINITDEQIKSFYDENKSKLKKEVDGKMIVPTFEEIKPDLYYLLYSQEAQKIQGALTDRLIEAQNARIFAEKVKD